MVAAIGVTVALVSPVAQPRARSTADAVTDPRAGATLRVERALHGARVPPGAYQTQPARLTFPSLGSSSPNEVWLTANWLVPGTPRAVVRYLLAHPPAGMTVQNAGTGPGVLGVNFATDDSSGADSTALAYAAVAYHDAVALQVVAWTVWVPHRPAWSFVPATMTSADVMVVRRPYTRGAPGAPTVRRTLTGEAALRLARAVDRLPAEPPEGVRTCPPPLVEAYEIVDFHSPDGDLRVEHTSGGCGSNADLISGRHRVDPAYVNGAQFGDAVLRALGLPSGYGYPR